MKRLPLACVIIVSCILAAGLCRTAVDAEDFTGKWYSSADQKAYLFQDGLLYCSEHAIPLSDRDAISGAYCFSRDSIFLFAKGISGLEREKELFLVHKDGGSFLCENRDGTGPVYFIRSEK